MRIQQKIASYKEIHKWKTNLIGQANRRKVVYLSADRKSGPFKGWLLLVCFFLLYQTALHIFTYKITLKRYTKTSNNRKTRP